MREYPGISRLPNNCQICETPDNCRERVCNTESWDDQLLSIPRTYCDQIKHDGKWVAFEGQSSIRSTASLPQYEQLSSWYSVHSNFSTRWKASLQPTFDPYAVPTDASFTTDQSSPESTASPIPEPPGNSSVEPASSKEMTIGMAVGLGVGIPIILAGLGFLAYFLRRRRNKVGAGERDNPDVGTNQGDGTAEDSTKSVYGYATKAEFPADAIPAQSQVSEMEGSGIGNIGSPQMVSLSVSSAKGDTRGHRISGIDDSPVYELGE
ncbi:hypothetical protein N0V90_006968 [Kalmusia sp. IMI 367209]|nr:hypothetical protein N0V90_006968 [Kalmusia sp. IMI 367209]